MDVGRIIECIKQHDHDGLRIQLQQFNKEYAQCFFFDVEEWERRKRQELDEFRKAKVRDYVSDPELEDEVSGDPEIILRQSLASTLIRFLPSAPHGRVIRSCLRTLRILSRDKQVLDRLLTDSALITLARLAGFSQAPVPRVESSDQADPYGDIIRTVSDLESSEDLIGEEDEVCSAEESAEANNVSVEKNRRRSSVFRALMRGKRDTRASVVEDEGEEEEEKEADQWEEEQNKEAVKILCNVIYNSAWAQERAAELSLLGGLTEKLARETQSATPPSSQYYELRLVFLLTALRPELRNQLKQEGGVQVLTAVLERCVSVQWKEPYEVALDPTADPVTVENSSRAQEALKILFNITCSIHTQEPDEKDAALYRRLAVVLRHCLMVSCEGEDTDELKGHTVNLLSALPLSCLDVLLCVPLCPDSKQIDGVNMDCVHSLLMYLEKTLETGQKVKERLTPVLNLLTECCRAHRGTRRYLRQQILPPLRDVSVRPEQGTTIKSRLVRLMTHLDTELKHCAADLLFVLCKENVRRFVKYTGYGNAAGLLAMRGLLGGQRSKGTSGMQYSSDSDSDTEEYRQVKGRVNPVTGSVEEEQPDPMEGMTEEEKEEEARRLVKLINKLSKDNVIQAMGLDAQGQLTPLTGLRDLTVEEEGLEEEDTDDLENVE